MGKAMCRDDIVHGDFYRCLNTCLFLQKHIAICFRCFRFEFAPIYHVPIIVIVFFETVLLITFQHFFFKF